MFENIGDKIKALAKICTVVGIVLSCILGIATIVISIEYEIGDLAFVGIVIMGLGGLLSWVSSFIIYAFGEVVDSVDIIICQIKNASKKEEENTSKIIKAINENTNNVIEMIEANKKEQQ